MAYTTHPWCVASLDAVHISPWLSDAVIFYELPSPRPFVEKYHWFYTCAAPGDYFTWQPSTRIKDGVRSKSRCHMMTQPCQSNWGWHWYPMPDWNIGNAWFDYLGPYLYYWQSIMFRTGIWHPVYPPKGFFVSMPITVNSSQGAAVTVHSETSFTVKYLLGNMCGGSSGTPVNVLIDRIIPTGWVGKVSLILEGDFPHGFQAVNYWCSLGPVETLSWPTPVSPLFCRHFHARHVFEFPPHSAKNEKLELYINCADSGWLTDAEFNGTIVMEQI